MDGKYSLAAITKQETPKIMKISWIIVLCASFFCLCFYVKGCYEKLKIKPEILVNEKHIPSFDIPFPAVTICSPLNIRIEHSNLSIIRDDVRQNKALSPEAETILARSAHVCQTDFLLFEVISKNKSYNEDLLNTLKDQSTQLNEEFVKCAVDEIPHKCENVFIQSITEYGYCYTFNMIGYNSIFDGHLANEFDVYKRKKITKTWSKTTDLEFHDDDVDAADMTITIDQGYLTEDYDVQPLRAAKLKSILFQTKIRKIDIPNVCEYHPSSYLVFLHLPVDIPSHLNQFTIAQLSSYKVCQVSATVKTLDDSLKAFPPEKRGCYFENERKLQFFKSYSKTNCDFECMRNFTLTMCGCVKFSLLRTNQDKLCDVRSLACYKAIAKSWPNSYYKNRKIKRDNIDFPCYCLPSCTQIKYDIVNEHSRDFNLPE
jgi:amiloride-sensitive sodium channel